ncbi:MAG: hypothetical protein CMF74_02250 [Maricaulis sp.]|jgi:uncharacterized membrane protein|nr:hypothetical protein [Maricaulis sp.]HAQ34673.1 hypothetical protein [Alphaproteobacteria bacterium]
MRSLLALAAILVAACSAPESSQAQSAAPQAEPVRIEAPAWIRVSGVEQGDVLNARAEPDAGSEIVGSFNPGQGPVEIVEVREINGNRWGLVATGEWGGWINLHYAVPVDLVRIQDSPVPVGTVCHGTEPFWTLGLGPQEAVWSNFEVEQETYAITESESAASRPWPWMFVLDGFGVALLTPGQCSDGMSDTPYAWSVLVVSRNEEGHVLNEGCCRLEILEEPNE